MARKQTAAKGGGIEIVPRGRETVNILVRAAFRKRLKELSDQTGYLMMDLLDMMIDQVVVPEK